MGRARSTSSSRRARGRSKVARVSESDSRSATPSKPSQGVNEGTSEWVAPKKLKKIVFEQLNCANLANFKTWNFTKDVNNEFIHEVCTSEGSDWFGISCTDYKLDESYHVTKLVIPHSQLQGTIPAAIGRLTLMKVLDLSGNDFVSTIPKTFVSLENLETLNLGYNSMNGSLPQEMLSSAERFSSLENLTISHNFFTGPIGAYISKFPNLKNVDVSYNLFGGPLPASIDMLTGLKELDVGWNMLQATIPSTFNLLTNLKLLNLYANYFTGALDLCSIVETGAQMNVTFNSFGCYLSCWDSAPDPSKVDYMYNMTRCADPTSAPTGQPTMQPSSVPTAQPSNVPTSSPSTVPSTNPTGQPSSMPSAIPTSEPTQPTGMPTTQPTGQPSTRPTALCHPGTYYSCQLIDNSNNCGCRLCPEGTYNSKYGSFGEVSCTDCPAGTYNNRLGMSVCRSAPAGSFTASAGAAGFTMCAQSTFSKHGAVKCNVCPPGRVTSGIGATDELDCVNPEWNFIQGFIMLGVVSLLSFNYLVRGRFQRIAFLRKKRVANRLVYFSRSICTYIRAFNQKSEAERLLNTTNRYLKTFVFVFLAFTCAILIACLSYLAAVMGVIFKSLILFKSIGLDFAFTARIMTTLENIAFYIGSFFLEEIFRPFIGTVEFFLSLELNFQAFQVTCPGASAPYELLVNLIVMGVVIVLIDSDFQIFRMVTYTGMMDENIDMLAKHAYIKWYSRENGRKFVETLRGRLNYAFTLIGTVFRKISMDFDVFQSILQYLVSLLTFSVFVSDNGVHLSAVACNNAVGYENYDHYIAIGASLLFYLLALPSIWEISKIFVPGMPEGFSDLADKEEHVFHGGIGIHAVMKYFSFFALDLWWANLIGKHVEEMKQEVPYNTGFSSLSVKDIQNLMAIENKRTAKATDKDYAQADTLAGRDQRHSVVAPFHAEKFHDQIPNEGDDAPFINESIYYWSTRGAEGPFNWKTFVALASGGYVEGSTQVCLDKETWETFAKSKLMDRYKAYVESNGGNDDSNEFHTPEMLAHKKLGDSTKYRHRLDSVEKPTWPKYRLYCSTQKGLFGIYKCRRVVHDYSSWVRLKVMPSSTCYLAKFSIITGEMVFDNTYDIVDDGKSAEGRGAADLAEELDKCTKYHLVLLLCNCQNTNRNLDGLDEAVYRCGVSPEQWMADTKNGEFVGFFGIPDNDTLPPSFFRFGKQKSVVDFVADEHMGVILNPDDDLFLSSHGRGYMRSAMKSRSHQENFEWAHQKSMRQCNYSSLLRKECADIMSTCGIHPEDKEASFYNIYTLFVYLFACVVCATGVGHLLTRTGRRACYIIGWKFGMFLMVCCGCWTEDAVRVFDVHNKVFSYSCFSSEVHGHGRITNPKYADLDRDAHDTGKKTSSLPSFHGSITEYHVVDTLTGKDRVFEYTGGTTNTFIDLDDEYSATLYAVVATRAVLLQLIPVLSLLSMFAVFTAEFPIFVFSNTLKERLHPGIMKEPFKDVANRYKQRYRALSGIIQDETYLDSHCMANPTHEERHGEIAPVYPKQRTDISKFNMDSMKRMKSVLDQNLKQIQVQQWEVLLIGISEALDDSRYVQFALQFIKFLITLAFLFLDDSRDQLIVVFSLITILPFTFVKSFEWIVRLGHSMHITDDELLLFFGPILPLSNYICRCFVGYFGSQNTTTFTTEEAMDAMDVEMQNMDEGQEDENDRTSDVVHTVNPMASFGGGNKKKPATDSYSSSNANENSDESLEKMSSSSSSSSEDSGGEVEESESKSLESSSPPSKFLPLGNQNTEFKQAEVDNSARKDEVQPSDDVLSSPRRLSTNAFTNPWVIAGGFNPGKAASPGGRRASVSPAASSAGNGIGGRPAIVRRGSTLSRSPVVGSMSPFKRLDAPVTTSPNTTSAASPELSVSGNPVTRRPSLKFAPLKEAGSGVMAMVPTVEVDNGEEVNAQL